VSELHELTDKIKYNLLSGSVERTNSIVREYLKGCVKKCEKVHWVDIGPWYQGKPSLTELFNKALGLSPKTEPTGYCSAHQEPNDNCRTCYPPKQEPDKSKWCSHLTFGENGSWWIKLSKDDQWIIAKEYNFCPICAAPRPKQLSEREELAEKFIDFIYRKINRVLGITQRKECALEMADIALEFMKEKR